MRWSLTIMWLVFSALASGCVTAPKSSSVNKKTAYPSLDTITVEGHVIYYRDLSDPCDPNSTAWNNLNKRKRKEHIPVDCSAPIVQLPETPPTIEIPNREYVLLFAMRKKKLASPNNDVLVAELARMGDWPIRFHVYGAAGGVGARLEQLGMKRAAVVKEGLIAAGVPLGKIDIMPYDPTIPGLRAIVRLEGGGV